VNETRVSVGERTLDPDLAIVGLAGELTLVRFLDEYDDPLLGQVCVEMLSDGRRA